MITRIESSQIESPVFALLRWAAEHALWDMLSALVLLLSALAGFAILFWAKRRVRNLDFFTIRHPRDDSDYPLKIYVEIRNYTGTSVVISSPYFKSGRLRLHPNARGEGFSRGYEVRFPDPASQMLTEVECLLRHRENVATWIPIDPSHTDQEVDEAIKHHTVGTLHCMCTWLQEKPKVHKLRPKI